MEKLVRVIKLQPGESVLVVAEDKPAPCPCCACAMQNDTEDAPIFDGILLCLDAA